MLYTKVQKSSTKKGKKRKKKKELQHVGILIYMYIYKNQENKGIHANISHEHHEM